MAPKKSRKQYGERKYMSPTATTNQDEVCSISKGIATLKFINVNGDRLFLYCHNRHLYYLS
jgi:hypothetical protein